MLLLPIIWGFLRKEQGLPFMGAPTVSELDTWNYAGARKGRTTTSAGDDRPVG